MGDAARQAAWCKTHDDLAWLYDDGSVQCMYCLVVETSSYECVAEPLDALSEEPTAGEEPGVLAMLTDLQLRGVGSTHKMVDPYAVPVSEETPQAALNDVGVKAAAIAVWDDVEAWSAADHFKTPETWDEQDDETKQHTLEVARTTIDAYLAAVPSVRYEPAGTRYRWLDMHGDPLSEWVLDRHPQLTTSRAATLQSERVFVESPKEQK